MTHTQVYTVPIENTLQQNMIPTRILATKKNSKTHNLWQNVGKMRRKNFRSKRMKKKEEEKEGEGEGENNIFVACLRLCDLLQN